MADAPHVLPPGAVAAAVAPAAWAALVGPFGAGAAAVAAAHDDLVRRHAEPARHYHGLEHVGEVLVVVDELAAEAADPVAVRLAAWFHDAVYEPGAAGNEAASAELAGDVLPALGAPARVVDEVRRLVLATAEHEVVDGDRDGAVLLDADLAILGAPPARYARYRADVRAEWARLPDEAWRTGRAAVLRSFLDRPRIYRTPGGTARREAPARANLAAELADLGARP